MGKVNILHLYPLSFGEFLDGRQKTMLRELINTKTNFEAIEKKFHDELIEDLKMYFFIGGMPEAVKQYLEDKDLNKTRKIQKEILQGYEADFAKHASKLDAIKIATIWKAIPSQLAKENKKFTFSILKKHARPRDYNEAIQWLISAGYVCKSHRIKTPNLPLSGYIEENVFKLFLLDVGLLGAMLDLTPTTIIAGNKLFSWYNGAFTENFVAQELIANGQENLYYWASGDTAEVDFVIPYQEHIFPLEVKAGSITKAKSLQVYDHKYNPAILSRASQLNFNNRNRYSDYPLYAISLFPKIYK
ncbi:MAG: DUF4143 domain-containing protein [Elusimicrobiota bacterium]